MAKVYDALKRVEEERSRSEQASRTKVRLNGPTRTGWRQWFRSDRAAVTLPEPIVENQLLRRLEILAGEVESVRQARSHAVDVDARLQDLRAELARIEAELKDLEARVTRAVSGSLDGLRAQLTQVGSRAYVAGALALLALFIALLRV